MLSAVHFVVPAVVIDRLADWFACSLFCTNKHTVDVFFHVWRSCYLYWFGYSENRELLLSPAGEANQVKRTNNNNTLFMAPHLIRLRTRGLLMQAFITHAHVYGCMLAHVVSPHTLQIDITGGGLVKKRSKRKIMTADCLNQVHVLYIYIYIYIYI